IGRAESRQLPGQKVSEAAGHAGHVLPGRHDPGRRLRKRAPSLSERAAFPYDKGLPPAPATTASYLMAVSDPLSRDALDAFWMPFTANRQFKAKPRMLARASGMHYFTPEGRQILDGVAGLWCVNAGHGRSEITEAVCASWRRSTLRRLSRWPTRPRSSSPMRSRK